MSAWRKFNILIGTDIDIHLLNLNIERAKESLKTYKYDSTTRSFVLSSEPLPYIIMNYDTFQCLWECDNKCELLFGYGDMTYMAYGDYKVFINKDLEFGEVELR